MACWILGIKIRTGNIACSKAIETIIPMTDIAIELGGEDAKITFFRESTIENEWCVCRWNRHFIDRMAVLSSTILGLNEAAKSIR